MKKAISVLLAFCFAVCFFGVKCSAVSAKAAVLLNGETGEILYSKNEKMRLAMASTTKIMTAILLCENADLNSSVTVPYEAVLTEGTSMGLKAGDTVTCRDLLYGMMLSSGNDAANTVALFLSGSFEAFSKLMNEKAKELNLLDTNFVTPSGLDAENHFTSALDLANLTLYAMQNNDFCQAVNSKSVTLNYNNTSHTLTNHHKLVRNDADVIGVKTGFTKKAGRCLVTAAKRNGKYLIVVTLNDKNDWVDHRSMLETGFSALDKTIKKEKEVRYIPLLSGGCVKVTVPDYQINTSDNSSVKFDVLLPNFLFKAPKKNEEIGYMNCFNEYRNINTVIIKADETKTEKEESFFEKIFSVFKIILINQE